MLRFSYTAAMTKEHSPDRLDVKAFAQAGAHLAGHDSLLKYKRLAQEAKGLHPDLLVDWRADGELRTPLGGQSQVWLHLNVHGTFPMECQRCLTPVDVPLDVERSFRFVADEATAEAHDDDCEEDLLAISREFDLRELIEDELILSLPLVPVSAGVEQVDSEEDAVVYSTGEVDMGESNPASSRQAFAALAALKKTPS